MFPEFRKINNENRDITIKSDASLDGMGLILKRK